MTRVRGIASCAAAWAALLGAVGCSGAPVSDVSDREPDVQLGTGRSAFEPIPPSGGELELVGGPQGGFHVFVTARVRGLDVEGMTLQYRASDPGSGETVGRVARFVVTADRITRVGDAWVRAGDFLILDDASPEPVRLRTLDIEVRATDPKGREARDARRVLIVDDVSG